MSEAWVVNASPLVLFSRIGRLDLIERLAPTILVPNAVIEEVRAGQHKDRKAATALEWAGQYRVENVTVAASIEHWDLGSGESQVIAHSVGTARWAVLDAGVEHFLILLFEIRNTIHEASLSAYGHHTTGKGPGWFELSEGDFAADLWTSACATEGPDLWGLKKLRYQKGVDGPIVEPIHVHPYPYASQLVRMGIELVDRIAGATDVERLFDGRPTPDLVDAPPEDGHFAGEIRDRLALLG